MIDAPRHSIWAWRHPRPQDAEGRCIGRTDLAVDCRRAKRLARRIQKTSRREDLPRIVYTSPLRRCADVGRWLRCWGWVHRIDPALAELDFGSWDGRAWTEVDRLDIDTWCERFASVAPGGGESLTQLFARAAAWCAAASEPGVVVAHGGWMLAVRWMGIDGVLPARARDWPQAPRHGALWRLEAPRSGDPTERG